LRTIPAASKAFSAQSKFRGKVRNFGKMASLFLPSFPNLFFFFVWSFHIIHFPLSNRNFVIESRRRPLRYVFEEFESLCTQDVISENRVDLLGIVFAQLCVRRTSAVRTEVFEHRYRFKGVVGISFLKQHLLTAR